MVKILFATLFVTLGLWNGASSGVIKDYFSEDIDKCLTEIAMSVCHGDNLFVFCYALIDDPEYFDC